MGKNWVKVCLKLFCEREIRYSRLNQNSFVFWSSFCFLRLRNHRFKVIHFF